MESRKLLNRRRRESGEVVRIPEDDFMEWYEVLKKQRDDYKRVLQSILGGVPTIPGMACEYRKLTLKEIEKLVRDAL